MERQQFIKLIQNKGTSSKEETNNLWDIVRTFPYFQTARLLLVKSFHNQSSIHFHNELKTAAAYAGDRKVLFHLINKETTKQATLDDNNVFVIEEKQFLQEGPFLKLSDSHSDQFKLSEDEKKYIEPGDSETKETVSPPAPLEHKEELATKKEFIPREEAIEEKKSVSEPLTSSFDATTNEEIIRKRLSEILEKNKPEPQEKEQVIVEATQTADSELPGDEPTTFVEEKLSAEAPVAKEEPVTHSILEELPDKPADEIEGLEIETIIEENYLQELEKLPEISQPVAVEREEKEAISQSTEIDSKQLSFIDWLKQKSSKGTTVEEVSDEAFHFQHEIEKTDAATAAQSSELINKFIATSPRITPVKAAFYSPANMARQSITDNEDIISETLAQIYFDQENYAKARSCYERLSLLYPEKSASFAALIEKIDNILKSQI